MQLPECISYLNGVIHPMYEQNGLQIQKKSLQNSIPKRTRVIVHD